MHTVWETEEWLKQYGTKAAGAGYGQKANPDAVQEEPEETGVQNDMEE